MAQRRKTEFYGIRVGFTGYHGINEVHGTAYTGDSWKYLLECTISACRRRIAVCTVMALLCRRRTVDVQDHKLPMQTAWHGFLTTQCFYYRLHKNGFQPASCTEKVYFYRENDQRIIKKRARYYE